MEKNKHFPPTCPSYNLISSRLVDEAILRRYAEFSAAGVPKLNFLGEWIISLRSPVDEEFNQRLAMNQDQSVFRGSCRNQPLTFTPKK